MVHCDDCATFPPVWKHKHLFQYCGGFILIGILFFDHVLWSLTETGMYLIRNIFVIIIVSFTVITFYWDGKSLWFIIDSKSCIWLIVDVRTWKCLGMYQIFIWSTQIFIWFYFFHQFKVDFRDLWCLFLGRSSCAGYNCRHSRHPSPWCTCYGILFERNKQ